MQTIKEANPISFVTQEVVLPAPVEPSRFVIHSNELSQPAAGQVIVRVEASGISFAEQAMRRDRYPGQPGFPFVPGYDLVGTVVAIGPDVDASLLGKRVAALTKTGGWASYSLRSANELLLVPAGIDPAEAEALVVNGLTAWQMLHRKAHIRAGQTIVVHGANGGVGTTLVQLARHAGVRVIGLASRRHHATLKEQGVEPVDYTDPAWAEQIRQLTPDGVDAVFDNVGGAGITHSFRLLKRGGILVSYAMASVMLSKKSMLLNFINLIARLMWWNLLPNGRKAIFFDVMAGRGSQAFQTRSQDDFARIMSLLAGGVLTPRIAARFPLDQIRQAMELAESRTVYGKVILIPNHSPNA
ncbi:medium chain dehydrogenase/reductase family protein [Nostoc sp. CHAB 5834]|nr:medium chain dehydrogenase/reductase family protein [Nostoc sp. CHAB 5834]